MNEFLPVTWFDALPSTNSYLLEGVRSHPDSASGTVVAAREQRAGRGRQGRAWKAEAGRNLTFSFLWNAPIEPSYASSMAQGIAVGIARYLEGEGIEARIKWPNDVLVGGRKIGGILCEMAGPKAAMAIVAGVGLNVNMTAEEAAAIDQPATSMALVSGRTYAVETVLDGLLVALHPPLMDWASGGFEAVRARYEALGPPFGTEVSVRDGESRTAGRVAGYTELGGLKLALPDGTERVFYSGDLGVLSGVGLPGQR